jgi:hypothetical protein
MTDSRNRLEENMDYLTIVRNMNELKDGKESEMYVKDLSPGKYKYSCRAVKAMISSAPESLPGADKLWVRYETGVTRPKPWAIKVTAELGDYIQPKAR